MFKTLAIQRKFLFNINLLGFARETICSFIQNLHNNWKSIFSTVSGFYIEEHLLTALEFVTRNIFPKLL
jgi:hypothetical protein